jgi:hypothetical protein
MLDFEDYRRIGENARKTVEEWKSMGENTPDVHKTSSVNNGASKPQAYESPMALILYIIVMIGGSIFYDRVLIWVAATAVYLWHKIKNK